jgi:hypothetical protein
MKLVDTEKEADKARKDSKLARDHFNDVKLRRFVLIFFETETFELMNSLQLLSADASCLIKLITTSPIVLMKCIRS